MTSLYHEIMELPGGDPEGDYYPGVRRKDFWFFREGYQACEGILDARRAHGIDWGAASEACKRISRAQRQFAIALWLMGEDDYESWVPWYWKLLGRRKR